MHQSGAKSLPKPMMTHYYADELLPGLWWWPFLHYNGVIMVAIASQITSLTIVYWTVYSDAKKTSKLRVTGLCAGNSPGTGEFPAQMASYAENVSIWWRHHGDCSISPPIYIVIILMDPIGWSFLDLTTVMLFITLISILQPQIDFIYGTKVFSSQQRVRSFPLTRTICSWVTIKETFGWDRLHSN